MKEATKARILQVMPLSVGTLPVRYLGVPLISKRLYCNDYLPLIEKARSRIMDWKNKVLSFAGRLPLILSVVSSMQVYWFSMFILPVSIATEVERLMRDFLWNFGVFKRGKAKVKWSDVCKRKVEGGLGIKSLEDWNIALVSKHIWNLISCKNSLWVKWIHIHKLKGRNFWDILEKQEASWSWRRIIRIRGLVRDHIFHKIGNGASTSPWFDTWHPICPLSNFVSKRKIYQAGLSLNTKVFEMIDKKWTWPKSITDEFDGLLNLDPPVLCDNKNDKVLLRTNMGRLKEFSI